MRVSRRGVAMGAAVPWSAAAAEARPCLRCTGSGATVPSP